MGSNSNDYLKEGFRITRPYGNLFIAEPKKKWEGRVEQLEKIVEEVGFKVIDTMVTSRFLYIQASKL